MSGRRGRALAVSVLLAVLAGCSGGVTGEAPASSPSATPSTSAGASTAFPYSDDLTGIDAGTYRIPRSEWSVADFNVTFPEGWTVQYSAVFSKHADTDEEFGFYAVVPDAIFADACEGESGDLLEIGPGVDDLASALLEQPGPKATGPVATTLGGYPATRIDLTVPTGLDLEACSLGGIGLQIWYSPPAEKYFILLSDAIASVYIVDVDGQRQVFLAQRGAATSDEDLRELQAVLDSIDIET